MKEQLKEQIGRKHFYDDFHLLYMMDFSKGLFDKWDVMLTAITDTARTYIAEIKDYNDEHNPRPYNKFNTGSTDNGYQIDYDKVDYLVKTAQYQGRTPILYARFSDWTIIWNLNNIPYQERMKPKITNKKGTDYGKEKELSWQTYLYKDEAVWIKKTHDGDR